MTDNKPGEVGLREALRPFMPISTHDTPDYAELTFGEHQTQAMTMAPDDWNNLNAAYAALSQPATENAELVALRDALGARFLIDAKWFVDFVYDNTGMTGYDWEKRARAKQHREDCTILFRAALSVTPGEAR